MTASRCSGSHGVGERRTSRVHHDKILSRRKVALRTEESSGSFDATFAVNVRLRAGGVRRYSTFIPVPERPGVQRDEPWAYFLTFACYGNRLHGHEAGSVDRHHNACGARLLEARPLREAYERRRMVEGVATLDSPARKVVLEAIQEVCRHEGGRSMPCMYGRRMFTWCYGLRRNGQSMFWASSRATRAGS
jgi:hypothetical protein